MFTDSINAALMEKAYSALWQRQRAITSNIANEDTPGYKAKRVEFEGILAREMNNIERSRTTTKRQAIGQIRSTGTVEYELGGEMRTDENNVDLDSEHMELARAQIQYQLLQQRITSHYTNLKYAINGGR